MNKTNEWLAAGALGVVLLAFAYCSGERHGSQSEKEKAAIAQTQKDSAEVEKDIVLADSLKRVSAAWLVASQKAVAHIAPVAAKTDTAHLAEDRERTAALALARDSLSTALQLRQAIDSLSKADSTLYARFLAEREANQRALQLQGQALATALQTITADSVAFVAQGKVVSDLRVELKLAKSDRPSVLGNILRGVGFTLLGVGIHAIFK